MNFFGVSSKHMWHFGDGATKKNRNKIKKKIKKLNKKKEFDTVITYERFGIYGHVDHTELAKIIHELHREGEFKQVYYATVPKRFEVFAGIRQSIHNLSLEAFSQSEKAEVKITIFDVVLVKYLAAKKYKSQKLGYGLPLFLLVVLMPFEYYTTTFTSENQNQT